jgi:hypothetical protein
MSIPVVIGLLAFVIVIGAATGVWRGRDRGTPTQQSSMILLVGDPPPMYHHRQIGYLTFVIAFVAALGITGIRLHGPRAVTLGVVLLLLLSLILFSSLTVEIRGGELRLYFGPGFWRKRFAIADVAAVHVTESRWWEGWGIRITPRGTLYNVSGTGAVEVVLRSGDRFRIGTDEPERLAGALSAAIGAVE